jgi:hypothetical protein
MYVLLYIISEGSSSESSLLDGGESVVNVLSEGSELSIKETDGLGNDFLRLISLVSVFGVLDVFIITDSDLFVVLGLLLLSSEVLFSLLVLSNGDSLVKSGDFGFEVTDLSVNVVKLIFETLSGGFVFMDPMLVSSSLDFSGFSNLVEEFITDGDDLLDT